MCCHYSSNANWLLTWALHQMNFRADRVSKFFLFWIYNADQRRLLFAFTLASLDFIRIHSCQSSRCHVHSLPTLAPIQTRSHQSNHWHGGPICLVMLDLVGNNLHPTCSWLLHQGFFHCVGACFVASSHILSIDCALYGCILFCWTFLHCCKLRLSSCSCAVIDVFRWIVNEKFVSIIESFVLISTLPFQSVS